MKSIFLPRIKYYYRSQQLHSPSYYSKTYKKNTVFLVFMIITIHESTICDISNFHGLLEIFIIEIFSS